MNMSTAFLISLAASVAAFCICKWLERFLK